MQSVREIARDRLVIFNIVLVLIFVVLLARFFTVQILEGDRYYRASEQNRIRHIEVEAPRGLIRDRQGVILVDNRPAYSVFAIPHELKHPDSTLAILAGILNKPADQLRTTLRKRRRGPFQRVKLARFISFAQLAAIEERKLDLPGLIYDIEPRRAYPSGVKAPHLFGYLGEISESELNRNPARGYQRGDVIGIKGLEKVYEAPLRGEKGDRFVEVDALGRELRVLDLREGKPPAPGQDVFLTIDASLQEFLESQMENSRGGAVVLNSRNGEVIAFVSKPDYDPELFTRPISEREWQELNNQEEKPLFDRVLQGMYPPGSTYKIVLAIAGLETGLLDTEWSVICRGAFRLGRRSFGCWNRAGHGRVTLRQALERSCNVYFYRAIQRVGLENWVKWSRNFQIGEPTGIDLSGESRGLLPDSSYLNTRYGTGKWSKGLLLNMAIGQGDLLATPLQMAVFALKVANRGIGFRPFIVKQMSGADGQVERGQQSIPDTIRVRDVRSETWDFVHAAMFDVVNSPNGTAKGANPGKIHVAGKTGTAQAPRGEDHAWFIGFAPVEDPQVAFAIFLENGGGGGANAAPIAREMLRILLRQGKIEIPRLANSESGRQASAGHDGLH